MTTTDQDTPLIDHLAIIAPDSSKTTLRSWIKEGRVTIDGKPAKRADEIVSAGQKVFLGQKPIFAAAKLRIIYEDSHLVAIEKPEGMLSVATAFEKTETAHALLKRHFHPRKVHVVHRIDQDTSGVMVFALSDAGFNGLKELFEQHTIQRSYYAVVEGNLLTQKGSWQSYLYEDATYMVHSTDNPEDGVLATTHFQVEKTSSRHTLLKLTLETGRKNQIRVHCFEAGCPIVGDKKYGASTDPIKRLCLHAASLEFNHPVTRKPMRFNSPVPDVMLNLLNRQGPKGKKEHA